VKAEVEHGVAFTSASFGTSKELKDSGLDVELNGL